jgi:hypothetical protein
VCNCTSAFYVSSMISHSIYKYVLYILRLYVWHVNYCYGMSHCLWNGLVELIVLLQAQHISNRKYGYSCTINDECTQTFVCVYIAMLRK